MKTITYTQLIDKFDVDPFLFNKAPELDENLYDNLENGSLWQDDDDIENSGIGDIFQWYLIKPRDAEYLKDATDELVFYSEVLDEYVWGVTHFGTTWDGVELEIKEYNHETGQYE